MLFVTFLGFLVIAVTVIWMCTFDKHTIQKECSESSKGNDHYMIVLLASMLILIVSACTFIVIRRGYL